MSKVLVIGDSCTDVFIYGKVDRLCPEAPVPVINPIDKKENGGMARNVKSNLEALGVDADIITNLDDIKKIRYVDDKSNQMVLRVDEHDWCDRIKLDDLYYIKEVIHKYDAVIISDYCKGFLKEGDITDIIEDCTKMVFIDTKKKLGEWVKEADYIKINDLEYIKNYEIIADYPELEGKLITTQGSRGCKFMGKMFPTQEVPVKDVSGAGDTFLAGLVCEYLKSQDIKKSIEFAQKCTTKVVQKLGVSTV